MIKQVINFFISLKTAIWLLCLLIVMLLAGAVIMPANEEFQSIHSVPMLEWIKEQPLGLTWWLWSSIGLLTLLTANTLFCSVDSILKKRKVMQWLLILSPQIIHIGFLFILLAHLFSSALGFKGYSAATEGTALELKDKTILHIKNIRISIDNKGYLSDWAVDAEYIAGGKTIKEDSIMPNKPSMYNGLGVYVKDLRAYPEKMVLLELSREPGAVWALIGGILFMTGTIMLIILKWKRDK